MRIGILLVGRASEDLINQYGTYAEMLVALINSEEKIFEFKTFNILDAPWVHKNGVDKVIKKIIDVVKDRPAYLTFDIDGLDPAYAPGTGTPVAGGLTSAQALAIIRGLDGLNFIGADVVEVAPAYDHAEITAIAAATIAHDYLVIRAKQKMKSK